MFCPEGSPRPSGVGECPSGFYCPTGIRLACPVGTYCPREGHWDPMPCPPGEFSAMVGQAACTSCPRGYICPGFGRIDPTPCPSGMVCSRIILTSPNQRCPPGKEYARDHMGSNFLANLFLIGGCSLRALQNCPTRHMPHRQFLCCCVPSYITKKR